MKVPEYWGVVGFPVEHSLTPKLFNIVGEYMGIESPETIFIEARNIEELTMKIEHLSGTFWLSVTSPLKHLLYKKFEIEYDNEIQAINQITNIGGEFRGINTDGLGFIEAIKYYGIEINESILRMKGGGSTARSIAYHWTKNGGKIIIVKGRRELALGPWSESIISNDESDISINFDSIPGTNNNGDILSKEFTTISYNRDYYKEDFAIIMLVAQHLEAWKIFFLTENIGNFPSIDYVLNKL